MDWLHWLAVAGLALVSVATGGIVIRVIVLATEIQAAAVLLLVLLLVMVAIAVGARGRRWRQNPYW